MRTHFLPPAHGVQRLGMESNMIVYHICHGRPIGPSFEAYLERPEIKSDDDDLYGTWVEETTLDELTKRFCAHIKYMKEADVPEYYFPYELKIGVRR